MEAKQRVAEEPYFIGIGKYNYDLRILEQKFPNGVEKDSIVAAALMMTEAEVVARYQQLVVQLRDAMGVRLDG